MRLLVARKEVCWAHLTIAASPNDAPGNRVFDNRYVYNLFLLFSQFDRQKCLVVVMISEKVPSNAIWTVVRHCATKSTLTVVNAMLWDTRLVDHNPLHCKMAFNISSSKKISLSTKTDHYCHRPRRITSWNVARSAVRTSRALGEFPVYGKNRDACWCQTYVDLLCKRISMEQQYGAYYMTRWGTPKWCNTEQFHSAKFLVSSAFYSPYIKTWYIS
jgi:hypothetical protein